MTDSDTNTHLTQDDNDSRVDTRDDIRHKLIVAGRILAAEGHGDFTRGHLSVRLPDDPGRFLMKPHSVGLDELTPHNILTIDLDGNVVAGTARRHSEVFIHTEILKARPDVVSVIHSHAPHCVALSATGRPLRACSQPGALFSDGLGVYRDTIALIRSSELGRGVAAALAGHRAVLLKNHGVAVVGASVEEAVITAIMLETAARVQLLAEAAGEPAPAFPPEDVARLRHQISQPEQFAINFAYLARRLEGRRT